ncbi:hypothetical protein CARUB_v10011633mg [Capsella rubella]|uniref:Uncharacterized protein n=1 Tax=Capsella rubella TaxID=81985 RepID=R0II60_9BRAS|nr:uncharacterized protein LOC17897215 [Capsella rubella]EOA36543.1 hypothetical protein CARUB_v10011633mg [Capsella rubella]
MENTVNMFGKNMSPRSPTRLQRQAPTALHLDSVPDNPFLQQSCESVPGSAIPLLSPLFVSPNSHSCLSTEGNVNSYRHASPSRKGHDFTFPSSTTEKKGSQLSLDHEEGLQYPATVDHSDQMGLLNIFQTKCVLVDHSQ